MPNIILLILGAGVLFFLLTVFAIIDISSRTFGEVYLKALWIIVVTMVPFLGCVLYFAMGRRQGART